MIYVCSLSDLEAVASALPAYGLMTLLSPSHTDLQWRPHAGCAHLQLAFNDITGPRTGLIPPDRAMIADIVSFGVDVSDLMPLLIHCWAGISRSSAAAYIIGCARNPGQERAFADELRRRAPFATPNPLMISLADDLLVREGRMIEAIAAIGRGAEASAGTPYRMPLDARSARSEDARADHPNAATIPSRKPISPHCSIAPRTSPV